MMSQAKSASIASPATPPTTPPAMAPTGVDDPSGEGCCIVVVVAEAKAVLDTAEAVLDTAEEGKAAAQLCQRVVST